MVGGMVGGGWWWLVGGVVGVVVVVVVVVVVWERWGCNGWFGGGRVGFWKGKWRWMKDEGKARERREINNGGEESFEPLVCTCSTRMI